MKHRKQKKIPYKDQIRNEELSQFFEEHQEEE